MIIVAQLISPLSVVGFFYIYIYIHLYHILKKNIGRENNTFHICVKHCSTVDSLNRFLSNSTSGFVAPQSWWPFGFNLHDNKSSGVISVYCQSCFRPTDVEPVADGGLRRLACRCSLLDVQEDP